MRCRWSRHRRCLPARKFNTCTDQYSVLPLQSARKPNAPPVPHPRPRRQPPRARSQCLPTSSTLALHDSGKPRLKPTFLKQIASPVPTAAILSRQPQVQVDVGITSVCVQIALRVHAARRLFQHFCSRTTRRNHAARRQYSALTPDVAPAQFDRLHAQRLRQLADLHLGGEVCPAARQSHETHR